METKSEGLNWIIKNKKILNISNLEKYIGLPSTTLHQFLLGNRKEPIKHLKIIDEKVNKIKTLK